MFKNLAFKGSILFLIILTFLSILIIITPSLRDALNHQNLNHVFAKPNLSHPFGTDQLGRDLFLRVVAGFFTSLSIALVSSAISFIIGVTIGLLAALSSPSVDKVILGITNVFLSIPPLLLSVIFVFLIGHGITALTVAMGVGYIPFFIRSVRIYALSLLSQEFIIYSRSLGATRWYLLKKHLLKPIFIFALIQGIYSLQGVILGSTSLSFIGVGVSSFLPEWGNMLGEAQNYWGSSFYFFIFSFTYFLSDDVFFSYHDSNFSPKK
jgi:peptide/nickel transport system permease protein